MPHARASIESPGQPQGVHADRDPAPEPNLRLAPSDPSPLGAGRLSELVRARRRARPLRRAARTASLSAWSTLALGACALPFGLGDMKTLALALAFVALGYNELCARRALFRFEANAPARLALNQLALAGVLIGYAVLSIYDLGPITIPTQGIDASLVQSGSLDQGSIEELSRMLSATVYAGLIVGTILFQGSTALYYITRRAPMRRFLALTPPWVVETMRTLRAI